MNVTVLIPAYQPAGELVTLTEALHREGFRIVVVDDGSGPEYIPVFAQVAPFARVLSYPKNGGKGFALKHGLHFLAEETPRCDAFITADADGQHSVRDICRVRDELEKGYPFVLTTRELKGKDVPFRSRLGNNMSRFICALSGGYYLPDNQSGLRGFTAEYLPWLCKISGNKYDYEMNVLLYAERQELPIRCLPIEAIYLNDNQSSHFDPVRDTVRIYLRVLCTARVSVVMAALHFVLMALVSCVLGWQYSALTIPLAALLIAIAKDNPKLAGKTGLKRLIQDGEELTIFSIKQDDLKGFQMESKRYGVLFYPIVNKVEKTGTVEIMAKAKDAKQINRIFERMGYPAPVQSDARKQRPRAPSENSFRERGSGARTSTEMDKPSVREKVKALKAELEAARRREPVIPVKENDLAK